MITGTYKWMLIILLTSFINHSLFSQSNNYKVVFKDGKNFYLYEVGPAEGFYSLTNKFNISQSEIEKYNPETKGGLKYGQKLLIPVTNTSSAQNTPNDNSKFIHTVQPGETLSSIARTYNVTIEQIKASNNEIPEILTIGHSLIIPQPAASIENDNNFHYHTIAPKETLYSVSKNFNVSMKDIMQDNPGLNDRTFSVGKIIRIRKGANTTVYNTTVEVVPAYEQYKVKRKETFYSISKKFDVDIKDLIAANPGMNKVKAGDEINIPLTKNDTIVTVAVDKMQDMYNILSEPTVIDKSGNLKIVMMLPLQLNEINSGNSMQSRYIEFYQGFLLAVDSLKSEGLSFDLYVYDTSTQPVSQIIKNPIVGEADLIIGPASNEEIAVVSEFAKDKNINIISPFTFDAESTAGNPNLFQLNTPSSYLNTETAMEFSKMFKNQNIVFLKEKDQPVDKKEFLDFLKNNLSSQNINYYEYEFSDGDELGKVDSVLNLTGEVVFIPQTVKQSELGNILPSLLILKKNNPNLDISVFGFPEWQQYASNFMEYFYELNTYLFSRIYANPFAQDTKRFNNKFQYWYGKEMMYLYPRYGMVGFDIGMYFLKALNRFGKNFENHIDMLPSGSIQTAICFKRSNNWSGFVNRCIYFVNFRPNGTIEKIEVK